MRALAVVLAVAAGACGGGSEPPPREKGLGQQAADVVADTATVKEAQGAVNDAIRATGDCDALKGLLPGAYAALDAADSKIRTATGRLTLEGLRRQLRAIAEACP